MVQLREIDAAEFDQDAGSGPAADVTRIVAACDAAEGVSTLNEQTRLHLANRGLAGVRLWLGSLEGGEAMGLALLQGHQLDIAVHPAARGAGLGAALAHAALTDLEKVEAWSHADHPAAARIAERFGVPLARELLIMERSAAEPLPDVVVPEGVRIRTFTPADEQALLAVNAAAFAHHPEQGTMSVDDLHDRMAQPWFDADGLFLAVPDVAPTPQDDGFGLLGFHWTKEHRDEDPAYGEVYVVGVSPSAAGRGLGKVLTNVGLHHLAGRGLERVILYVEGDNEPALALYAGLGFTTMRTEVQYGGALTG